jgi:hypothetical protein
LQRKFDSELKEARLEQSKVHKEYFQMESAIKSKEKELEEKVIFQFVEIYEQWKYKGKYI